MNKSKSNNMNSKTTNKLHSVAAAYSKPVVTKKPKISGNPYAENGSVRIRHTEFLSDINGQTASFANSTYDINPGLVSTFPWLSLIADNFESYKFHSLKFCYEPITGTGTQGSVLLAVDFDSSDEPASNKQQFMSYHNAVRCAAWESTCYKSSTSDLLKFGVQRYIRSSFVPDTDVKTYDVGTFQIATTNFVTSSGPVIVGELYVEYDVELLTPNSPSTTGNVLAQRIILSQNQTTPSWNPISTDFVGGFPISLLSTNLASLPKLTFPRAGRFLCCWYGGATATTQKFTSLVNVTITLPAAADPTIVYLTVTQNGGTVELSNLNLGTSFVNQDLHFTQYPLPLT